VAFAEVEKFIDTPCKHYSSGMYTRLGFAVAAHLDTDILLVDEVLSVGDADFQRRCLDKMNAVAGEGRTILLVSHNLSAVNRLCTRARVLSAGRGRWWGADVRGAISDYLLAGSAADSEWRPATNRPVVAGQRFSLERLRLTHRDGSRLVGAVAADEPVFVEITGVVEAPHPALCVGFAVYAEDESALFWSYQTDADESRRPALRAGRQTLRAALPAGLLNEGRYRIDYLAGLHGVEWIAAPQTGGPCVWLEVRGVAGNSAFRLLRRPVLLAPVLEWSAMEGGAAGPEDDGRAGREAAITA
jgi:lipopolysaccharide transport system ATP-binding protein